MNNHRLVECHKFLQLMKGKEQLLEDMKRKITRGNQKPHRSALRAQSGGGSKKDYCSAKALAAAQAFDVELSRQNKKSCSCSNSNSNKSTSPSLPQVTLACPILNKLFPTQALKTICREFEIFSRNCSFFPLTKNQ